MLEPLQLHAERGIELRDRPREHHCAPAGVLLHDCKPVRLGEFPDRCDILGVGTELPVELLAGEMAAGALPTGELLYFLLQRIGVAAAEQHADAHSRRASVRSLKRKYGMFTVTFYSYRGGVGRTTALVNVAVDLALRRRKVLLLDFDLEAPSLNSFAPKQPDGPQPGLVEFIDAYVHWGKTPESAGDYVYQIEPVRENSGEIWVMPAGRGDNDYWRAFPRN